LPHPQPPLTVGVDGCYVRQWEDKKAHFEVIVGKSMAEDGPSRCFGFVQTYDEKPKRRLFELLKRQGMQMNQRVMFFSDGGTDIREVQLYLNPEAEHYLDWFHITMRLTVMGQYAKGLDTTQERRQEILKSLESVKHYLWHGNVVRARDKLEDLHGILDHGGIAGESSQKLRKALDEFDTYVVVNEALIPNYGERWRNEEAIATGFVESAVNQIVSKRFSKKQQMQWTKKGAHLVLQMRTQVLDERQIPCVTGIRTSGQNPLKTRSSRRLKHPDFMLPMRRNIVRRHLAGTDAKRNVTTWLRFWHGVLCGLTSRFSGGALAPSASTVC
jgi:hypothetical protein